MVWVSRSVMDLYYVGMFFVCLSALTWYMWHMLQKKIRIWLKSLTYSYLQVYARFEQFHKVRWLAQGLFEANSRFLSHASRLYHRHLRLNFSCFTKRHVFLWVSVVSLCWLFTNENLNLRSAITRKTKKSCGHIGKAKQFCGQGVAFKTGP